MLYRATQNLSKLVNKQICKFSGSLASHRNNKENTDSQVFDFTPENYKEIENILKKYPSKKPAIMPLLWLAQYQNNNYLSLSAMKKVAKILEVPDIDVYEVASFYTMYNRERVGKFHLQICGTTPCQLCGAREIVKKIEEYTGTRLGETSKDGMWTLSDVECLGACANAPMVQVNNDYVYEDLTVDNVIPWLEALKEGKAKVGSQTGRIHSMGIQGRTSLDPEYVKKGGLGVISRDFQAAKKEWEELKAKEREEAEKRKAQAAQQNTVKK